MKAALVHDWLNGMRGGEKCLEVFCEEFPNSPIYTLFAEPQKLSAQITAHPIHTSFLQGAPGIRRLYRNYLPLFPLAAESLRLPEIDLLISTNHCVAKGVRLRKPAKHLCYCFTPMRYAWSLFDDYFADKGALTKAGIGLVMKYLRDWDRRTASRVDRFVAISEHIRRRIQTCYGREADVVYPPVDTNFYCSDPRVRREDFYLIVSALVPYKRVDLAVRVFNNLKRPLHIIGDGPEAGRLKAMAQPHIRWMGWQPNAVLRDCYRKARALIFPGEEDFGIVPVEAQACGCPVIALGRGGALETVLKNETGVFFDELEEQGLVSAILDFEKRTFSPDRCISNASRFHYGRFRQEMRKIIKELIGGA